MNKTKATALASAVVATLGGSSTVDAAIISIGLTKVFSHSGSGAAPGNITSSTATWSYDDVTNLLSQTGGTFNVRFTIMPTTTLFRHSTTGLVIGAGAAATGSTFNCTEGNFGVTVGASVCGNYNFGGNFTNQSSSSWGPGLAFARTLGGDDAPFGAQQNISAYNDFATVSFDGTHLVMSNGFCNPFAPGNANGCATTGGVNAGYSWNLSTIPIPAAVWLFGGALGVLGVVRRRSAA